MPWLNDWVVHVARKQKQFFSEADYDVLYDRNISKEEHLFLIKRLSDQLTSISEVLSYFGCVDAAQKIDEAIEEIDKVRKNEMLVIRRRKRNVDAANPGSQEKPGAKILELHEG